ncbi:hypothetical protein [Deinococcus alpinitundrae]|uniref:hypothetical protein n=1 Tax=Deinococcus alpinitundrae TaxID=468913 RepID=UPI001379A902|nr:hypothetical protein [Deinococcus alpinitundrae]
MKPGGLIAGALKVALLALLLSSGALAFEVRHGFLTVIYQDPRDRQQLGGVFQAWDAAARDLRALGLPPPPTRIEAALSAADFAARTREPANIAASTQGAVIRTQRFTALARSGLLPFTIRHEAFHTTQPTGIPRWLAEGLARSFSGEARRDPPGLTGLASLSSEALSARLLSRDPVRLAAAYVEATRRAGALVRARGYRGALKAAGIP